MIKYSRTGGFRPPRDRELLTIDNKGHFRLWRSVSSAKWPPTAVGLFGGQLEDSELTKLQEMVQAAERLGDLEIIPPPGSAIERVTIGSGIHARLGIHNKPDGPWGSLLERLRQLLADLTAYPQAALKVTVTPDGRAAHLTHLGDQPLPLDLSNLTIRAVLWQEYQNLGDWRYSGPATWDNEIVAEPGWSLELPFAHGFKVQPATEVVAYVTTTIFDKQQPIPVGLESPRRLGD